MASSNLTLDNGVVGINTEEDNTVPDKNICSEHHSLRGIHQYTSGENNSVGDKDQTLKVDSVYNLTPLLKLEKRFIRLFIKKKWNAIEKFLNFNPFDRQVIASRQPLYCGDDYPLHLICDLDARTRIKERICLIEKWKNEKEDERIRRNKIGGTSSDEAINLLDSSNSDKENLTTSGSSLRKIEEMLPPTSLILTLLKAYPQAAKCKGWNARLPLHHVVHHNYPPDVIKAVFLAYPEALDIKDNMEKTPRDIINSRLDVVAGKWDSEIHMITSKTNSFDEIDGRVDNVDEKLDFEIHLRSSKSNSSDEGVEIIISTQNNDSDNEVEINNSKQMRRTHNPNVFLDCSVSCWIDHSRNVELQNNIDKRINVIQEEVGTLRDELTDIYKEEAYLNGSLDDLTKRSEDFLLLSKDSLQLPERIEILKMAMFPEFEKINTCLENVNESWDPDKYLQTEEDSKYITAFNEDLYILYEKMNSDMATIKEEIKSLNL